MEEYLENKRFDEISVGDSASFERVLSKKDIILFAIMSGDANPAHLDEEYAKNNLFHQVVALACGVRLSFQRPWEPFCQGLGRSI